MSDLSNMRILLVGAGKMGSALLASWLRAGAKPEAITVVEADAAITKKLVSEGVATAGAVDHLNNVPDAVVIAVKPHSVDALLPALKNRFGDKPVYVSIAAGKTLGVFAKYMGDVPVVRAMPNTPALIGKGITVLVAGKSVSEYQKQLAESLMKPAGEVLWLDHESLMDTVTALSGSGPGYTFLFMEALVEAAKANGMSEAVARTLVLHTVQGSAALALHTGQSLAQLRTDVASPGGTTEAALGVLMKRDWFQQLIAEAVAAAVKRSKELM